MKIRKSVRGDKEQVLRLVREFYFKHSPKTVKTWESFFNKLMKLTLVIEKDKKLIGFVTYSLKKNSLYIDDLYIRRAYRKKGLGTKLINKINNIRKKLKRKYLVVNVRKKDEGAFDFYKTQKFKLWKRGDSLKLRR